MSEENRPEPTARRLSDQSQLLILAVFAVIALVAVFGVRLIGMPRADEAAAVKPAEHDYFRPTKAQWEGIRLGTVRAMTFRPEVDAEGNIALDANLMTPVYSPYSGRVVRLIAKLGDHVAKGAPLMAVEATQIVDSESDLIAAVSTLGTAESQLTLAKIAERREHQLYLAKGAALKDWQESRAELTAARNTLRTARIALAAVRNRLRILGKSDKEIDALENATGDISPMAQILAPIAGTVTQRKVGLGQYISSDASDPVYTIGDLSTVWLVAKVRQEDASQVRLGEPVEVRVLAYPGRVFDAKLSWVASAIDPNTHRLPVRADVENPDGTLKPMMFARFAIITGPSVEKPAVPEESIIHEGDSARVWVARPNGTLAPRQIKTGEIRRGMTEILAGLSPGEKVVTSGTLFIDRAARGG